MKFRSRYDFHNGVNTNSVNIGDSLTEQHHAETTDVNKIVATFNRTGRIISGFNRHQAFYGDVSQMPKDLLEAHAIEQRAIDAFRSLPIPVQEKFGRNPEAVIEFVQNPANREEAIRLGLIAPPAAPAQPEEAAQGGTPDNLDN